MDGTTVTEHEHGLVRVFHVDDQLSMEIGHIGTYDRLCRALGITAINHQGVQQLGSMVLSEMKLSNFLMEAHDIPEADIEPHAAALDALEGMVLVIRSSAFDDRPLVLKTGGEAVLVATFQEPDASVAFASPMKTDSAKGILTPPPHKKKPSDAAMSGRVATIALLVMAFLVWLMIKVAG